MYAPTFQGFQRFRRGEEDAQRKISKPFRFGTVLEDRDPAESARCADSGISIRCDGNVCFESPRAHIIRNFCCNFRIRSEQPLQAFNIKNHRSG